MIISIEGSIGIGKSTVINTMAGLMDATPHVEELDEEFLRLLGEFNYDSRNAITLQRHILNWRTRLITELKSLSEDNTHIIERSVVSDLIFSEVMNDSGFISPDEYDELIHDSNASLAEARPDLLVYLRCEPEEAWRRAVIRKRSEESDNDAEYFEALHCMHDTMIPSVCYEYNIPYITIQCTREYPDPITIAEKIRHVRFRSS